MNIGNALKEARKNKGYNQVEASIKIGISQTYLSQIEGDKKKASADMIEAICKVYNIPVQVIIWKSVDEKLVAPNKRKSFKELKPLIDNLINQIFS
ncbi:MAG: helix-turn-helix transcriptional regulator [Ferruginibacter sp.]